MSDNDDLVVVHFRGERPVQVSRKVLTGYMRRFNDVAKRKGLSGGTEISGEIYPNRLHVSYDSLATALAVTSASAKKVD